MGWDDPGIATLAGWQVQTRAVGGGRGDWTDVAGSDQGTTGHTVTGLRNGRRYAFRVRMVGAGGPGAASDEVAATPPVLPAPAGLAAAAGDGEVTLSWDDPGIATLAGWQVQTRAVGGDRGDWTDVAGSDQGTTSHTVTGLRNGRRYAFRVRMVGAGGPGAASDEVTATPERIITPAERYALAQRAASPGDAVVACLEIRHPELGDAAVRVVNDAIDLELGGRRYAALRFDARLADDVEGRQPAAELWIDNIGRDLTQWIEAAGGGAGATVRVMQALRATRSIEWEMTLDVLHVRVDQERVTARLGFDPLLDRRPCSCATTPGPRRGSFDFPRRRALAPLACLRATRGARSRAPGRCAARPRTGAMTVTPHWSGRYIGRAHVEGHHIGLWCAPAGEPSVLHCQAGLGTVLHPLRGLEARGLEPAGIYRWTTRI